MSITTIEDIRVALVDPDFEMDEEFIQALIQRAESMIRLQGYDIENLNVDAVKIVTSNLVRRVLNNPDGIRQETESTGPSSRSVTYAGALPGEMILTQEEKALLTGKKRRGAFSINLAPNMMKDFGWEDEF